MVTLWILVDIPPREKKVYVEWMHEGSRPLVLVAVKLVELAIFFAVVVREHGCFEVFLAFSWVCCCQSDLEDYMP